MHLSPDMMNLLSQLEQFQENWSTIRYQRETHLKKRCMQMHRLITLELSCRSKELAQKACTMALQECRAGAVSHA